MPKIKTLKPYIDEFVRTNDSTVVQYDTELYFMQAVADLVAQEYEASEAAFKYVLDEFPDSHQEANCIYWYAMSQLFLQKYAEAQPNFEKYIKKFPAEQYVDECTFQVGICKFGLEDYVGASNQFSYVINTYPDSSVYPEACSMRGDIYGSEGLLDEAVEDYERAYGAAKRAQQATYATFQMAEVYEAEEKYEDILRVVGRYEEDWKEEADIAKALFWIGKTKIQQKLYDEAVETYVNAIVEYGGDLRQDGVDDMITELVKISAIYLDNTQREALESEVDASLAETEKETLALRLRVLMAKLTNTELELGKQLLVELDTLDHASPPVLATICDASFENKDYTRAEELLRIFINKFEDSDFMRAAYKLRGFGQFAEKDYDGTLATINDAQALYGTDYDVAWAQLLKARVLLAKGDIEEARNANMSILTVPSWRGVPVAQATFQLGQVETKARNYPKAHAFYQRTYMQYKGHAGGYWAAEAYLAAAEILKKMGRENDMRNTYRAFLFDKYVNMLPQADVAREALGSAEVAEIVAYMETGGISNINVTVEAEMTVESNETPAEEEGE
jgi:TolA-binding protein